MLNVKSGIDPKMIKKDYANGSTMKKKKKSDDTKGLFSKKNKLPFMVKIKMAVAMKKKSKSKSKK